MKRLALAAVIALPSVPGFAALPGADLLAKVITKQFDTNSDGLIDQGEWQNGIAQGFKELDADHDGCITGKELDGLAGPLAEETGDLAASLVAGMIKKLVLTMDKDKDGSVSEKEFNELGNDFFTKLDTNKNGSIEAAELLELPAKIFTK